MGRGSPQGDGRARRSVRPVRSAAVPVAERIPQNFPGKQNDRSTAAVPRLVETAALSMSFSAPRRFWAECRRCAHPPGASDTSAAFSRSAHVRRRAGHPPQNGGFSREASSDIYRMRERPADSGEAAPDAGRGHCDIPRESGKNRKGQSPASRGELPFRTPYSTDFSDSAMLIFSIFRRSTRLTASVSRNVIPTA